MTKITLLLLVLQLIVSPALLAQVETTPVSEADSFGAGQGSIALWVQPREGIIVYLDSLKIPDTYLNTNLPLVADTGWYSLPCGHRT